MEKKIQINFLAHYNRESFFKYILYYLLKLKDVNKEKIKIVIHNTTNDNFWNENIKILNDNNISCEKITQSDGHYMSKIRNSLNTDIEYTCSMDDDILINNFLWDYLIEKINVLDDNNNLFLAPLISNGIPSVDLFIEDFMNEDEQKSMHYIFKNMNIPKEMWGANYSNLNKHTIESNEWNYENFYREVSNIDHYYKGIHPIRPSYIAQMKLAEIIMNNYPKFESCQNYSLDFIKKPYFCNSFYFIKTDTWKKIINDNSLFRDSFDEVPLNLYKDDHDLNMVFVKNGFCIHMAYNTIGEQKIIENYYIKKLSEII